MTPFPPPGYPPPPTALAQRLFEQYLRRQVRRHFSGVYWMTPSAPERWDRSVPTIFVANHTNWWDGFIAFLAGRALGLTFQVLMEARHLARYRVFLRVGALPLRRERAREAYADLTAAAAYVRPGTGMWVFPQGRRRPPGEPVRGAERGVAHLVLGHEGPVRVCPVALRYAFLGEQLPEAFVLVGESWIPAPGARGRAGLMDQIEARLRETVAQLDGMVQTERVASFEPLAAGKLSVNKRLDRFRHAIGLLRGPFEARNG